MDDIGSFVHYYSSTALFGEVLKAILCIHMLFSEVTVLVFKTGVIDGKQLAKYLTFHLLYKISEGVAIDEATFLRIMSMQIEVKTQSVVCY